MTMFVLTYRADEDRTLTVRVEAGTCAEAEVLGRLRLNDLMEPLGLTRHLRGFSRLRFEQENIWWPSNGEVT